MKKVQQNHPFPKNNIKEQLFANCRCISEYEKLTLLGEGTFGSVYSARDKTNNEIVAIKKVSVILFNSCQ